MGFVVDEHFPIVDGLEYTLEALEEDIFDQVVSRDTMPKVYELKRSLVDVKRSVARLMDVTNRLLAGTTT